jgi:Domain of unknown function (DUF4178)
MISANCPNCGAPVEFKWSSAVQTTCPFCKSILVRRDVNLQKVGVVADLPPDSSPIQIGTEGAYMNKTFVAIGRIIYEYELGGWNEWHIMFSDGVSGWLSDAQCSYALTFQEPLPGPVPEPNAIQRGQAFDWGGDHYEVSVITRAHYKGVEGELPFEYWNHNEAIFADLRTTDGRFGTIDYSMRPTVLYLGAGVEYDDLHLKNVRHFEGWN